MSLDQERRLEEIFSAVRNLPPRERIAFLERACGGDAELRRQADSLLAAHEQVGQFLQPMGALSTSNAPVEKPGDRIDRYKLLEQIGEGGFGVVWMAEQEEPVRRRVALKIIKLGMDTKEVVARFEAERQALAMMDHPHIASVFDGGATNTGRPYFVMELVKGVPITDYCDANKLPTPERLELFMQVCQAVQHAHQKGVIHRDLKPSNILVTVKDDRPVPKVIDFGVAKATQARLTEKTLFTQFRQWIGTPAYMSPEQAGLGSLDVDTRSDVYSLGVLLYELLAGRTPFDTEKLLAAGYDAVLRSIREQEPPKPSTRLSTLAKEELNAVAAKRGADSARLNRLLRGDLDWIVMKALEKDRSRRYETANALAADLERHFQNEPVVACPPSRIYRIRSLVRRNKGPVAAVGAVAFVLVLGGVVSAWQWRQAVLARRGEEQQRHQAETRAVAEAKAKAEAEKQRERAEAALGLMEIQRAEELFAANDSPTALAYLAHVLRRDSNNRVAVARLMSALMHRTFPLRLTQPLRHDGSVHSARFSPDGQRVVTVSRDKTSRVWDAQTGQPLTEPLKHNSYVTSAQFSPDGQRVVTASGDNTARVWDARTGQPLTEPLKHNGRVVSAQFSPEGQRVVTASWDNTARVWDARTGQPLTEPLKHNGQVMSAQFSPEGQRVVTASSDNTARVWDAQTGQPLSDPLKHNHSVLSAQFSPDGQRVVTASWDNTARVWDARTGQPLTEPLKHNGQVMSAQFSPEGQRVVTASWDSRAGVWDAWTGRPLTEPLKHSGYVESAQFSPDGQRVVTASYDNTAQVWDARTGQPLTEPLRHYHWVRSAQFSPDGQRVVTASGDHTARVWDARTSQPSTEPLKHNEHNGDVLSAQFSPDGQRVVTASDDNTARVWDARTGQPLTEPLKHNAIVWSAQFSADGQRVVTASGDHTARVWDARTGQPLAEPLKHKFIVWSAQFSPDGQRVVTASYDATARVWDARTGQPLAEPLRHNHGVRSAQFGPDGQRVVTASIDGTARVWDARTGQPLTEPLRHNSGVISAQFSPDGQRVVTASGDNTARVWDAQTGQPLSAPLKHNGEVMSAQFCPDGQRVVTATFDHTARVWDARTGQPLSDPLKHNDSVWSAQFSPDGQWVVTASGDKTARVWDVPLAPLPAPQWLLDLVEAVGGKRINPLGVPESDPGVELMRLKRQVAERPSADYYSRWAQWFFADRAARTVSPNSSITVAEYVQRRIQENSLESLQEAVCLSPTNGLAFARLAKQVLAQSDRDNPRRAGEADFFSRRATELSPNDTEVQRIRAEILRQIKDTPKPQSEATGLNPPPAKPKP